MINCKPILSADFLKLDLLLLLAPFFLLSILSTTSKFLLLLFLTTYKLLLVAIYRLLLLSPTLGLINLSKFSNDTLDIDVPDRGIYAFISFCIS